MKKILCAILVCLFATSTQVLSVDMLDLEPCINGEVSASGLFVNQEAEDAYFQRQNVLSEIKRMTLSGDTTVEMMQENQ